MFRSRSGCNHCPVGRHGGARDGVPVGLITLGIVGIAANDPIEGCLMHSPKADEVYVASLAVTATARGKGAGTEMLKWGEGVARARGASRYTLGVVRGNPAIRLYERYGFVKKPCTLTAPFEECVATCILGCPHGLPGGHNMEKPVTY